MGTTSLYNPTTDNNGSNTEYILNPIAKRHLDELYTQFGVSKYTPAFRLSDGPKNCKSIKPVKPFWCTINKFRGLIKS